MAIIDILIEGRADFSQDVWHDYASVTLITRTDGKKIICDPGCNRNLLLSELKKRSLTVYDIDYVFITHAHLDHSLLAGIFPSATIVTGAHWWENGTEIHPISPTYFGDEITIVRADGHSENDAYLLIQDEKGSVCVAGDLFWWDIHDTQESEIKEIVHHNDRFAIDKHKLENVRSDILKKAQYIIPGHGKPFHVTH